MNGSHTQHRLWNDQRLSMMAVNKSLNYMFLAWILWKHVNETCLSNMVSVIWEMWMEVCKVVIILMSTTGSFTHLEQGLVWDNPKEEEPFSWWILLTSTNSYHCLSPGSMTRSSFETMHNPAQGIDREERARYRIWSKENFDFQSIHGRLQWVRHTLYPAIWCCKILYIHPFPIPNAVDATHMIQCSTSTVIKHASRLRDKDSIHLSHSPWCSSPA